MDQQQRQLEVRHYSKWYFVWFRPEVDVLEKLGWQWTGTILVSSAETCVIKFNLIHIYYTHIHIDDIELTILMNGNNKGNVEQT